MSSDSQVSTLYIAPEDNGSVVYEEEYISSRGLNLFTCKWVPRDRDPKALVFICHGYAMECSITMKSTAIRLVNGGYATYGIDYEGHGKSGGLPGLINNLDDVVDDCSNHFTSICEKKENKGKMRYLLGESMGGAIALLLHRKKPDFWDGAILVAPMCKIKESLRPPPVAISVLSRLCNIIPSWKILPGGDLVDLAFKVPKVREEIRANKYCFKGWVRLKTGYECTRVSMDLEKRLNEVSLPFIVLHGKEDKVTDEDASKQLHEEASSPDKTLKLYDGMWHGLLYGEPIENSDRVFSDIMKWLDDRTSSGNSRLERELKQAQEESCDDRQVKD